VRSIKTLVLFFPLENPLGLVSWLEEVSCFLSLVIFLLRSQSPLKNMADGDWLGFAKDETKTWSSEFKGLFKSLIRSIYKLLPDGSWVLVVSNDALANRIIDGFAKVHNSQLKSVASHIDFLDMEPTIKQAWEFLQKTLQDDNWNVGDEVLGDEEKDGPAELLLVVILCKCAVVSYMWDMVQGGSEDGEVPSISTLTNLLYRLWREQDRAGAIKHLSKGLDKAPKAIDFLTSIMKGRGHATPDKLENVQAVEKAAAQREQELRRENERLRQEAEDARRRAEEADQVRRQAPPLAAPRGGGGTDRGGRGGRGGGGRGGTTTPRQPLPPFTLLKPTESCDKTVGGCGGAGHLKAACCGVQGTFPCDRCGGIGHKWMSCPSSFSQP